VTGAAPDLDPANQVIGHACQDAGAACCKQGKIFLPEGQHRAISRFLAGWAGLEDLAVFEARLEHHDGFALYDQQDRCQFLDQASRCRLYATGVRPLECLWWPLHVYAEPGGDLGVHAATWCCAAAAAATSPAHAAMVAESAEETGPDLIRRFRETYPGRPGPLLRTLDDPQAP
jgi:Fe-S-cluster containining protein